MAHSSKVFSYSFTLISIFYVHMRRIWRLSSDLKLWPTLLISQGQVIFIFVIQWPHLRDSRPCPLVHWNSILVGQLKISCHQIWKNVCWNREWKKLQDQKSSPGPVWNQSKTKVVGYLFHFHLIPANKGNCPLPKVNWLQSDMLSNHCS